MAELDTWPGEPPFVHLEECSAHQPLSRDCTQRRPGFGGPPVAPGFGPPGVGPDPARAQQFDSEYASLMAELGETSATAPIAAGAIEGPGGQGGQQAPWNGPAMPGPPLDEHGEKIPPWRIPSNWCISF